MADGGRGIADTISLTGGTHYHIHRFYTIKDINPDIRLGNYNLWSNRSKSNIETNTYIQHWLFVWLDIYFAWLFLKDWFMWMKTYCSWTFVICGNGDNHMYLMLSAVTS